MLHTTTSLLHCATHPFLDCLKTGLVSLYEGICPVVNNFWRNSLYAHMNFEQKNRVVDDYIHIIIKNP
jgi:hypothetical protein